MRGLTAGMLLASLLAAGAGCIGYWEDGDCPEGVAPDFAFPLTSGAYLAADPIQPWDTVVLVNDSMPDEPIRLRGISNGASPASWTNISSDPDNGTAFGTLTFHPEGDEPATWLEWERETTTASCHLTTSGNVVWELSPAVAGESAVPGQGAMVYTAGFWENGTMFYTNIQEMDSQAWPRAGWYAWEGADPLPVYVYDEDRSEQPAWWKTPSSNIPPTGSPADPVVHNQVAGVEGMYGLGYFTTIQGFNEALKGLSTTTTSVVRLAPEEAYTLPGNEEHPLYGDAIVFYIKVVEVRDVPCPTGMQDLACTTPMLGG